MTKLRASSSARRAIVSSRRGRRLATSPPRWRSDINDCDDNTRDRCARKAPTGGAIDLSLSLGITTNREIHRTGVVDRLIGHAGTHRAVADHRDHIALFTLEVARHRHAKPGRENRRRAVRRLAWVVFAFRTLGEPGKPATLANRAGYRSRRPVKILCGIGLMTNIPDQPRGLRVSKTWCEGDGKLDDAEARRRNGHR